MRPLYTRAVALFVLALCGPAYAVPTLNLAETFARTKAKLAAGGQADILVLGDSLSFADGSYLPFFRNLLQNQYGNAGAGYQPYSVWTGGGLNVGWDIGMINDDTAPHYSLDGLWVQANGGPKAGYLKPLNSTIDLQYLAQPGGGSFQPFYYLNGREVPLGSVINTAGDVKEIRTWHYDVANPLPNGQLWYMSGGNGPVTLLGENNTTDNPGIRIHRAANGGWRVTNFLQRDATFDQQVGLLAPDLVMIMLGANDSGNTLGPEFTNNLRQLIDRVHDTMEDADILLVTPYDLAPITGAADHLLQRVVLPEAQLAEELGVGYINLHGYAGDYSFWYQNGYLADGVHSSYAGGNYLGNILYNAFVTDGASFVPEPASLSVLVAPLFFLRRRRNH